MSLMHMLRDCVMRTTPWHQLIGDNKIERESIRPSRLSNSWLRIILIANRHCQSQECMASCGSGFSCMWSQVLDQSFISAFESYLDGVKSSFVWRCDFDVARYRRECGVSFGGCVVIDVNFHVWLPAE